MSEHRREERVKQGLASVEQERMRKRGKEHKGWKSDDETARSALVKRGGKERLGEKEKKVHKRDWKHWRKNGGLLVTVWEVRISLCPSPHEIDMRLSPCE